MNNSKGTIIAAVIGAVATLLTAFFSVNYGEQKMQKNLQNSIEKVTGDNNTININSVDDFIKDYQNTKISNDRYAKQLEESEKELKDIKKQMGDVPDFKFKDLKLTINGKEIPINSTKSIVVIDGQEYYSKELAENFLNDNQDVTIKNNTMFIGKVIADKSNLVDQRVVDIKGDFVNNEETTDSYGNTHFNSIACGYIDGTIIYNLNRKYNFLKCSFSIKEDAEIDQYTNIIIEADNSQVYSIKMTKLKEPVIDVEIPINNCSLLKISCANKDGSCSCIISDAVVYN